MLKKTILEGLDLINQGEQLINSGKCALRYSLRYINSIDDLYSFFDEVYKSQPNCSVEEFIDIFKKETSECFPIDKWTVAHYFTDRNYPLFGDKESRRFPTHQELHDSIDLSLSLPENVKKWYGYCSVYDWEREKINEFTGSIRWVYDIKLNGYDLNTLLCQLRDVIYLNPSASGKDIQTMVRSIDSRFEKINESNIYDFKYEIGVWPKYLKIYNGCHGIMSKIPSSYDLWDKLYLHPNMQKKGFYGEHYINNDRISTLLYYKFNGGEFNTYLLEIVEDYRQSTGKTEIPYTEIDNYLQTVHGFKISSSPSAFVTRLKKSPKYSSISFSKGVIKFTINSPTP